MQLLEQAYIDILTDRTCKRGGTYFVSWGLPLLF
jgi:hypothetical protein